MYDTVIIGAGPAGLAAAVSLKKSGIEKVLLVDRESSAGGILNQCIHNGFGLHRFKEELTGPEYAERYVDLVRQAGIQILLDSCVIDIMSSGKGKEVIMLSEEQGLLRISCKAVVLAMGCREKNRGNIAIPGSRPAGILTAGFAQKMVNIHGYMPGKEVVILGSGDIGLIMARRMSLEGAKVKAVIEIQTHPGGLNRNIVQCLQDFDIPLYLSHTISEIKGDRRITSVEVSPVVDRSVPDRNKSFHLDCDTLLLSVGLIPENELSLKAGIQLDNVTRGPIVDANLMTSVEGVFACGNVLHVHDIVDWVSEESEFCGYRVARYIKGDNGKSREIPVRTGKMLSYTLPSRVEVGKPATLSLRTMAPLENVILAVRTEKDFLYKKKFRKIFPSIMQRIALKEVPADAQYIETFITTGD
ncbi:MAG TPA: pyridine nucleotide-disulfide oxidoreductase [Lentisphaeria bacterium]|nr:MAG: pyridine nucleotide-disulfide oxidoreductase [Lentisphaerae bacterium GWF2_50_93]HCE43837.1 pyridine nucleotide-disulfide oxidoreductase [Lentisphaeria bacterium]